MTQINLEHFFSSLGTTEKSFQKTKQLVIIKNALVYYMNYSYTYRKQSLS